MKSELVPAADAVADVLRRRAHPTIAPEIYEMLADLDQLTTGLAALAGRLGVELGQMTGDPALRTDSLGDPAESDGLADQAADDLWRAQHLLGDAAAQVRSAHGAVSRLYHDDETGPEVPR